MARAETMMKIGDVFTAEEAFGLWGLPIDGPVDGKPEKGPLPAEWYIVYSFGTKNLIQELDELGIHSFEARHKVNRFIRRTRKYANPKKEVVEVAMFPCYLFMAAGLVDPKNVKGVAGVLMSDGHYARISNTTLDDLKCAIDMGLFDDAKELREIFTKGATVRVTDGPFMSFNGKVKKALHGRQAEILLDILGRETLVKMDLTDLELT